MPGCALLFPGQGSQSIPMLAGLAAEEPQIRLTFEEAGAALGEDLWRLVNEGPAATLDRTEYTQPAMLAAGVAVWRVWQRRGGATPRVLAGHSLGEYGALVAAGAIDFGDAVRLVRARGLFMQEAVPPGEGAMAAVLGLDDDVVEAICRESAEDQVVVPANYNSPGQVVISGHASAIERAVHNCRQAGARRAVLLPVSVPAHSPLMRPAGRKLAARLAEVEIRSPEIKVWHNADLSAHSDPIEIRKALIDQLSGPVRWSSIVHKICDRGVLHLGECGPGKVLSGLGPRIRREAEWLALEQPGSMAKAIQEWSLIE